MKSSEATAGMDFELVGDLSDVETIAIGPRHSGAAKTAALVWQGPLEEDEGRRPDPTEGRRTRLAELHWYEAHRIGKKEFKRKRYLD